MAFAPGSNVSHIEGIFYHKETARPFEYYRNGFPVRGCKKAGEEPVEFPHCVYVGPNAEETRFALVLKTVAYVVVDENDDGWVVEKWPIKKHYKYGPK